MQRILVATDFSTRSDRALRRASLLARQFSAQLIVVNVVNDDQPPHIVAVKRREAEAFLGELTKTLCESDKLPCESRVELGVPFQKIIDTAEALDADLIVLGPHRRQILRDTFLGTTAERTIRYSRKPVLMANAVPVGPYDSILIATDLSDGSVVAAQGAKALGLLEDVQVVALNVLDVGGSPVARAAMTTKEFDERVAEKEAYASKGLEEFLRKTGVIGQRRVVKLSEELTAMAIENAAKDSKADLIVLGTHGESGFMKWLIGSVAESVLSHSEVDVLAVPPPRKA
jgi:nucleotide-binding universal stress UspA family protein